MVDETKPDLAKVMDRIKKLLALASSANEHEAARAAERAQALLVRYNIDLADVQAHGKPVVDVDGEIVTTSYPWRRPLGTALARLYFTRYFYSTFKRPGLKSAFDRHSFIGEAHNVVVAKMMFEYLETTVERLAHEGARPLPQPQRSPYRTSFRNACALRLCKRLEDRLVQAKRGAAVDEDTKTNLPALLSMYTRTDQQIDEWIEEEMGPDAIKSVIVKPDTRHPQGFRDGAAAGDKIGLDQQIGGSRNMGRLT